MIAPRVQIVRASGDDVDAVAEMFDLYRQFYGQESNLGKCRAFIDKRVSRSESVVFTARDEGSERALGFAQLYPTFCSVAASRIFVLHDLFVREEARNRGVGRQLLEQAGIHAAAAGASRLQLDTHRSNKAARHLYESLGFEREEGRYIYTLSLQGTAAAGEG